MQEKHLEQSMGLYNKHTNTHTTTMGRLRRGALSVRNGIKRHKQYITYGAIGGAYIGGVIKQLGDKVGGKPGRVVSTIGDVTGAAGGVAGELAGSGGSLRSVGDAIGGTGGRVVSTLGDVSSAVQGLASVVQGFTSGGHDSHQGHLGSVLNTFGKNIGTNTKFGKRFNTLNDKLTTMRENPDSLLNMALSGTGLCNTFIGGAFCKDPAGHVHVNTDHGMVGNEILRPN